MTRLAAVILALSVASTGNAALAQTCLSVLGCAAKSTGTSTVTSPSVAVGPAPGTPRMAAAPALPAGGEPLLYDGFGNLRAIPDAPQGDPNGITPAGPDLVAKGSLPINPNGPPAVGDPGAARLQAIPQDRD